VQPLIKVGLQFRERGITLLAKRDARELIQHRAMSSLDDAIRLRTVHLGPRMSNLLHGSIQLLFMPIRTATILCAAIGQHPQKGHFVRFKEGDHLIIPQIGRRQGRFPIIEFRRCHLTIGIKEGLLVDPTDALQRPDIEGILCPTLPGTFTLKLAMRFFLHLGLLQRC
jgi:hypothetical protein